ncbi:MAG TPA: acyltransferase [Actinomycetales bacterium]
MVAAPTRSAWRERLSVVGPVDGSRLAGLDGLRGIAVAYVVLDHAHVDTWLYRIFSIGGAAGVTTFFVLSGFLITSLLLREHDVHGRIDLPKFWGRRALRLLPAMWLWLAVITVVWVWAGWSQLGFFLDELVKPVFFYYSDFAVLERGLGPVAHTWSLSVEEQFYLVWPIVLLGALWLTGRRPGRPGERALVILLLVLTLVGAWWRLKVGDQPRGELISPRRPDTNAVCLVAGATVAALLRSGWKPPARLSWLAWPAVIAMLVVPRVEPVQGMLHPTNAVILLTVLALMALVGCLAAGSRVFTAWPLRAVGAVSYGFYLWHFPLMAAYAGGQFRPIGNHRAATSILIAIVSLGIAYLSFVLLERPLMRRYRGRLERVSLARGARTGPDTATGGATSGGPVTASPGDAAGGPPGRVDEDARGAGVRAEPR